MPSPILLLWLSFTDHGYGPVDPVPLPMVEVTRHDGQIMSLADAFGPGRAAVQFVFTECRTTCPLLGNLFQKADRLATRGRLVSISVSPETDTPEKLQLWRKRYQATDRWIALRPNPKHLRQILAAFGQTDPAPAAHSLQVFFVENGHYRARTTELPKPQVIAAALDQQPLMAGRNIAQTTERLTLEQAPCTSCHGDRLEGNREGKTIAPSLHGLTHAAARRGGPPAAYDESAFCRAINEGVDPAGVVLGAVMPRYQLTAKQCSTLWDLVR